MTNTTAPIKLTPAQRRALTGGREDGVCGNATTRTCQALVDLGLARGVGRFWYSLTPRGIALRDQLRAR